MNNEIINKVAESGLITIDLEEMYPTNEEVVIIDIANLLFQGLILREKDLREYVKQFDTSSVNNKFVLITCSSDAIVPTWAFMLIAQLLQPYARIIVYGNNQQLISKIFEYKIDNLDLNQYNDVRIVIKGCSKKEVPVDAYVYLTSKLRPIAKSLMYGEPCSTVPLYKRK